MKFGWQNGRLTPGNKIKGGHNDLTEWKSFGGPSDRDTHRITFDLIDGKPDCDSIRMESMD